TSARACDLSVMLLKMMDQRGSFILLLLCHAHGCLESVPHTHDAVPEEHDPFPLVLYLVRFNPGDFLPEITISHIDALDFARRYCPVQFPQSFIGMKSNPDVWHQYAS